MKLEVVTDASGLPLGMATAAASVSEQALLVPALNDGSYHNGVIRFDNGTEYEIQGICEWNRYNWRYASD